MRGRADGRSWDVVVGVVVVIALMVVRLFRRAQLYQAAVFIAALAFVSHLILIVLGSALPSAEGFGSGVDFGTAPTWSALVFSLALATLRSHGARDRGESRRGDAGAWAYSPAEPLRGHRGGRLRLLRHRRDRHLRLSAACRSRGAGGYASDLGTTWIHADRRHLGGLRCSLPGWAVDALSAFLGITGAIILVATVSTSLSGSGRLAYSMGRRAMLPRASAG